MIDSGREKRINILHKIFEAGIALKGLDAVLEIIGGASLFFISPARLNQIILVLTRHELSEDPKDFVANHLLSLAQNFSVNAQAFGVFYLLSHGIIKIFIVGALFKRKSWSYPLAMVFFALFSLYQVYRYTFAPSLWLIVLTIFDIAIIWLTWREYEQVKNISRQKITTPRGDNSQFIS